MKNPSSVVVIGLQILGLAGCSRQSWPSSANNLNWVQTISITRNANDLYAGCLDGTIRIWDFGRSNLRVWSASVKPIDSIDLSQDEKHLASGGMEPIVKLWMQKLANWTPFFLGGTRGGLKWFIFLRQQFTSIRSFAGSGKDMEPSR